MEDKQDVYENLAAHLDRLPAGFPRTPTGLEIRILKRLFSSEEAALAQLVIFKPETAGQVAERTGSNARDIAPKLEAMSRKGLIFRLRKGEKTCYMAAQFMVGIWEYHVNDLNPELIKDVNEYFPYLLQGLNQPGTPQVRIIPIASALPPGETLLPYEDAQHIIDQQEKIVVAPCICRREQQITGKGCDKPMESCLIFGSGADYYEENGLGRVIDHDEARKLLAKAEETGLVLSPSNAQNVTNICTCCGCCCQILKNLKTMPKPADCVLANHYAEVEVDLCIGCETCVERCQMDAIHMEDGRALLNRNRCIGCGLCVPTCNAQAIHLQVKKQTERQEPPIRLSDMHLRIAQERMKQVSSNKK